MSNQKKMNSSVVGLKPQRSKSAIAQRAIVKRSDDAIKKGVEAAFKANRRVNTSGITVASVNNGVVLLSGKTKSFEAHLESVEVANAVRGVRRVSTEVDVVPAS